MVKEINVLESENYLSSMKYNGKFSLTFNL